MTMMTSCGARGGSRWVRSREGFGHAQCSAPGREDVLETNRLLLPRRVADEGDSRLGVATRASSTAPSRACPGPATPVDAIVATSLLVPRFCRAHPAEARTLTLFRYADLMAGPPPDLVVDLTGLNDPVVEHISSLTERRYGRVHHRGLELVGGTRLSGHAVRNGPRPDRRTRPADWMDEPIAAASRAIALLHDGPAQPDSGEPRESARS